MSLKTKPTAEAADVTIGQRIVGRRKELGLSQSDLAAALGVTFQQVQKYEHGTNRVSATTLQRIADKLQMPLSYFFGSAAPALQLAETDAKFDGDILKRKETLDLIKAYYGIGDAKMRRHCLEMIKALAKGEDSAADWQSFYPLSF